MGMMSYKGPESTNQKSRKLGVFGQQLEGGHAHFIVILINIRENETTFKSYLSYLYDFFF